MKALLMSFVVAVATFFGTAHAALDPVIETAINTAGQDAGSVLGFVALSLVGLMALYWVINAITGNNK